MRKRDRYKKYVLRLRSGIENPVKNWSEQEKTKSLEESDGRQHQHRWQKLCQIGDNITE
jgi:hypothetical protein